MIISKFKKIKRALWTIRQPLTHWPSHENATISDLFVWRCSAQWQTYFELFNISSLFEDNVNPRSVTVVFFDHLGRQLLINKIKLKTNMRQTLDISSMVGQDYGEIGTFAVFHDQTPQEIINYGSFIAERGYVSYKFRNAPLRAYVHGNLDAVSLAPDGRLELLGGVSFFRRKYNLQHHLHQGLTYEFAMVNPTREIQRCIFELINIQTGKLVGVYKLKVATGGIQLLTVPVKDSGPVRLIIESGLIMARPLVFKLYNQKLDVFHG
jgi:hypothetical protein